MNPYGRPLGTRRGIDTAVAKRARRQEGASSSIQFNSCLPDVTLVNTRARLPNKKFTHGKCSGATSLRVIVSKFVIGSKCTGAAGKRIVDLVAYLVAEQQLVHNGAAGNRTVDLVGK